MSELKNLKQLEYSSKLDEIAKNDTEVFLKVKLSGRRTFGEYEFEPKNGFAVHFGNHIDVLDLDKCDVYQLDQPQLKENQKLLLEDLREIKESQKDKNMLGLIWVLGQRYTTKSNIKAFTDQEILEVLQALEQEEE